MSDFDKAVGTLEECIELIGDEIQDTLEHPDNAGKTVGFIVEHSGWVYTVEGNPSVGPRFIVQFPFNILDSFEELLDEEDAEEILDDPSQYSSEETVPSMALEILKTIPHHQMEQFRYHLIDQISTTDAAYSLMTEDKVVYGFRVSRDVFPLDDGYNLTEFSHTAQTVVSSGLSGVKFVNKAFNFEDLVENELGDSENQRYIH